MDRNRRLMVDISQSITYVNVKGSDLEKARVNCILHGSSPQPEVVQGLVELQNLDGGFPFGMTSGNLSTINETTVALWWMEEWKLWCHG